MSVHDRRPPPVLPGPTLEPPGAQYSDYASGASGPAGGVGGGVGGTGGYGFVNIGQYLNANPNYTGFDAPTPRDPNGNSLYDPPDSSKVAPIGQPTGQYNGATGRYSYGAAAGYTPGMSAVDAAINQGYGRQTPNPGINYGNYMGPPGYTPPSGGGDAPPATGGAARVDPPGGPQRKAPLYYGGGQPPAQTSRSNSGRGFPGITGMLGPRYV